MADTISLSDYGVALRETTNGLVALFATAVPGALVGAWDPATVAPTAGQTTINVYLIGDELTTVRDGLQSDWNRSVVSAQANYLVSFHTATDADDESSTAAEFGAAQAAVELTQRLHIRLGIGLANDVAMWTGGWSVADRSALWRATTAPMKLSFGVRVNYSIDSGPSRMKWLSGVIEKSRGKVLAFVGDDSKSKRDAAQAIADQLGRPLVEVKVESVVSKYAGETEQNLRQVFARAEDGGAVLFFDEADALFGKRTEIQDAHDRYAGDFGYLLPLAEDGKHVVVIGVSGEPSDEVARQAATVVRFPPE